MSSTFQLPGADEVEVKLCEGLSKEELLNFTAFKNWSRTIQASLALQHTSATHPFAAAPYRLRGITVQAVDRWGGNGSGSGGRIGFMKLQARISTDAGASLPAGVFLRGASVAMLVVLQPDDLPVASGAERYVVLCVQPRVAGGSLQFVELPAGMVDDGTFVGAAAREIKEELDLEIPEDQLTNLNELATPSMAAQSGEAEAIPRAVFPSVGGCDEYMPIFLHEKRVPRAQLRDWTGKLTGLRDEGEMITLKLVRLEDLWREGARDAKALSAWALYEGLKREGKI